MNLIPALTLLLGVSLTAAPPAKKPAKKAKPTPVVEKDADPAPPAMPAPEPPKPRITKQQVMAESVLTNLSPQEVLMLENAQTPLLTAKLLIAMHNQVRGQINGRISYLNGRIDYYKKCLYDGNVPGDVDVYVGLYDGQQTRRNKLVSAVNQKIDQVKDEIYDNQEAVKTCNSAVNRLEDLQKKMEAETPSEQPK
ncbi:hypothetical protein GETHOR_03640 [Geothrix oryzae]|uniref:Uncharacterized protein n=1 Tax=Geothrix oryzae TaxID=2927975 RepID=A0ABM8DMV7_9BACT|nr:hypothetical protein [Geothrix oryzae]BDU68263.1 hypothetical protein GETHOR_03640 [Geothrix oryzae]